MNQKVQTLSQPISSDDVRVPLVIRTLTPRTNQLFAGGVPVQGIQMSEFVLLSALPDELRERVVTAIKALAQG